MTRVWKRLVSGTMACFLVQGVGAEEPDLSALVPPGWTLLRSSIGELNGDKRPDAAVVLIENDPTKVVESDPMTGSSKIDIKAGTSSWYLDQNKRRLVVALGGDSGFVTEASNDQIVPSLAFPTGETLSRLEISEGTLHLGFVLMNRRHGDVFTRLDYRFGYRHKELLLAGATKEVTDRYVKDAVETRSYDFLQSTVQRRLAEFWSKKELEVKTSALKTTKLRLEEVVPNLAVEDDFSL